MIVQFPEAYSYTIAQAACKLAGRAVEIRHEKPGYCGRAGQALNVRGKAVVYVDPDLAPATWLDVFLHELGHVRSEFKSLPATLPTGQNSDFWRGVDVIQHQHGAHKASEFRADTWRDAWKTWAERNYKNYARWNDDRHVAYLRALTHWGGAK